MQEDLTGHNRRLRKMGKILGSLLAKNALVEIQTIISYRQEAQMSQ